MNDNNILYDQIGISYNATRQADPYIAERLQQLLSPKADAIYLDIGCGTGNYTVALSNSGLNFYGIEPSGKMLEIARSRSNIITWLQGTAEQIHLDDRLFDGVMATLTIHHWNDFEKALNEIYRVLKTEGKVVFFTATPQQMRGYWLNHYFPKMLADAILQMPSFETIENNFTETGFVITTTERYFVKDDLTDHFLYAGKNRPELYFDENIRRGISSFSALSNADEALEGLSRLRADINSNKFAGIQAKYYNGLGDYLFVVAQK